MRQYTVQEIDALREATKERIAIEAGAPISHFNAQTIEERVRTYIFAGVLADEVEDTPSIRPGR